MGIIVSPFEQICGCILLNLYYFHTQDVFIQECVRVHFPFFFVAPIVGDKALTAAIHL